MTVIAWDGKTLAADKQSTANGMRRTTSKIFRVQDGLIAILGCGCHGNALRQWFEGERNPSEWPRASDPEESGHIVHVTSAGVFVYNGTTFPVAETVEDKFMAFGSGRDYAMAAMHLGCDARKAVEVACVYETGCGMGIDTLTLEQE